MSETVFFLNLAILAALLALSGPIAFGIALAQRRRIAVLERRLDTLEGLPPLTAWPSADSAFTQPRPAEPAPAAEPRPVPEPPRGWATGPSIPISEPTLRPSPPPAAPTPPRPSFEERFGTRWTVWVGGIALALGAALLVRYSAEQGYFGPGLRMACSFALAFGLLAAGEALRRRLRGALPVPATWPDIPAMVTAAGTVALFGAIYGAHALYGFIGPQVAFAALGLTGLAAMVAALLHGPALAGLGLVGAMATPLLVGKGGGGVWSLTLYLPVVAASAYAFAWTKGWRALAVAAGIGAAAWALLLGLTASTPSDTAAALVHVVLEATLATAVFVRPHRVAADDGAPLDPFTTMALAAVSAVMLAVIGLSVPGGAEAVWIAAALAAVALPAAAGFFAVPAAVGLALAGVGLAAGIVLWPPLPGPHWNALLIRLDTASPGLLVAFAGIAGLAITGLGALRLLGGGRLRVGTALAYAGAATLTPLVALALLYLRLAQASVSPSFALACGLLALLMTGLAALFRREALRAPSAALAVGLGAHASAAVAALALGLVCAVSGGSLTVAMALAALGTAGIARRLDIPALRWCVAGLGLIVAARLAWDPLVVGADLGRTPILNWLLVGYGVPALAFGLAARWIRLPGRADDAPVHIAETLALLLAAFLVFFEIRHALHDGDILADATGLAEQGLMALSALGFSLVLTRLDGVHGSAVIRGGSLGFGVLAFAQSLIGLGLVANPLLTDDPVAGGLVFNEIALAYGLPALAALALMRLAREHRPLWYVRLAGTLSLALGFLAVTLLVRHGFQGARLGLDRDPSQAEWYAYSAGWLGLGLALLGYGILRDSLAARLVSAALVGLATLKVFLFDLAGLDGALRALSFLGLGAVLIGIGLVYQRFVFAPARTGG